MVLLRYLLLFSILQLPACALVDDYILGKDNTLKPAALPTIKASVHLVKDWSTPVGKPSHSRTYLKLQPVQSGQTLYTADPNGQVTAVDAQSGRLLWLTQLSHPIVSGPTLAGDTLIVGTNDARLLALAKNNGHQLWQAALTDDALSLSATDGYVVISKTIDGHLYAFDRATGKQHWMLAHGSPNLILRASSSPKIMGSVVLAGYSDGKLDAVDLANGRLLWQRSIAYANGASDIERLVDIAADPVIRHNLVYLASYQGYLGAFNLTDGQFVWSKPASVYNNIALDHDTLYVSDSQDVLWAYQRANGRIKWKQNAFQGHGITAPLVVGENIIIGDKTGYVHVIAKTNGVLCGREQLPSAIDIAPVQSGNTIVVMTADGLLQSFHLVVS